MNLSVLASGSKGNAALLATDTTAILIDNGLPAQELTRRLSIAGQRPEDLEAVILSHEHGDHCAGVKTFLRHTIKRGRAVPIYATDLCAARVDFGVDEPPVKRFAAGSRFMIGNIEVESFTVMHDAADPVNFVFTAEGIRIGWSTDLGCVPPAMKRKFADCQVIVLESNHDLEMLQNGPHPEEVKIRVAGNMGHLSNEQGAEFLAGIRPRTDTVVLSHLSADNNRPDLALFTAEKALSLCGSSARVMVASQTEVLKVL
ncbi:MAG: MBL fold metallo-hydrolase [Acidobacteriota bacterium]